MITEKTAKAAMDWCEKHPGWQRICDIDSSTLYKKWDELSKSEQRKWDFSEEVWSEHCDNKNKFCRGIIAGDGKFYRNILTAPTELGIMTVFKTGVAK